jgi:hypothetical protein
VTPLPPYTTYTAPPYTVLPPAPGAVKVDRTTASSMPSPSSLSIHQHRSPARWGHASAHGLVMGS